MTVNHAPAARTDELQRDPRNGPRVTPVRRVRGLRDDFEPTAWEQPCGLRGPSLRHDRVALPAYDDSGLAHERQARLDPVLDHPARAAKRPQRPGAHVVGPDDGDQRGRLARDVQEQPAGVPTERRTWIGRRPDENQRANELRAPDRKLGRDLASHRVRDDDGVA